MPGFRRERRSALALTLVVQGAGRDAGGGLQRAAAAEPPGGIGAEAQHGPALLHQAAAVVGVLDQAAVLHAGGGTPAKIGGCWRLRAGGPGRQRQQRQAQLVPRMLQISACSWLRVTGLVES